MGAVTQSQKSKEHFFFSLPGKTELLRLQRCRRLPLHQGLKLNTTRLADDKLAAPPRLQQALLL